MPPDWVRVCVEGQRHSDGSCTKLPLGVRSALEKKKKEKTSRSRERTAGNALHIVYSLHSLIRLITLPVLLARAQRQAHKHGEFEGLRVCQYISMEAWRRAQPSTKLPAECNYRLRLLVNLPVLNLVRSLYDSCKNVRGPPVFRQNPPPSRDDFHFYNKQSGNKKAVRQQAN